MSIKRNFVYNFMLNVTNVIFPLITAPYISRVLAPQDIGLFNFASTYSGYFALVAALGIPTYGIREIARHKNSDDLQHTFSEIFTISIFSTLIASVLYIGTLLVVNQLRESIIIFLLSGVVLYLKPFSIEWLYQGLEKFDFITVRSIIVKTMSVVLMFCFVRTKADLLVYLLIFVFCQCANQIWNTILLKKIGLSIKLTNQHINKHLKPVIILFLSTVAVSIYTALDTIMIGFISGYSDVAYYTHANHIVKLLISLVTSLAIVTLPRISQLSDDNNWSEINAVLGKSFSFISFLVFPLCAAIFLMSPVFVPLFYGDAFMGTIIPLEILSFLIILIGFSNLTGMQILVPIGKDKCFLVSVLVGMVTNLILNLILIPKYGASGASVSSVISELSVLCVMLWFIHSHTHIRLESVSDMIKALVGSVLLIPIYSLSKVYFTDWSQIFIFTIVGSLLYLLFETIVKNGSVVMFINIVKNTALSKI